MKRKKKKPKAPLPVRLKTQYLIRVEGDDPETAYAKAWSMYRAGRLTSKGKYIHVKKRKKVS